MCAHWIWKFCTFSALPFLRRSGSILRVREQIEWELDVAGCLYVGKPGGQRAECGRAPTTQLCSPLFALPLVSTLLSTTLHSLLYKNTTLYCVLHSTARPGCAPLSYACNTHLCIVTPPAFLYCLLPCGRFCLSHSSQSSYIALHFFVTQCFTQGLAYRDNENAYTLTSMQECETQPG